MVRRAIKYLSQEISGLHQAAYFLGFFTLITQILGLFRDSILAGTFGAGEKLDVYYTAFKIPDFIFSAMSIFAVSIVLVPLFAKVKQKSHKDYLNFIYSNFTALCSASAVSIVILYFALPFLLSLFFPSLYNGVFGEELVMMSRIILLSPFLLSLSGLFGAITQSQKRFFVYALSPILYNIGIIFGVLYLYPIFGLVGLAYGVVLGALLHAIIQLPALAKMHLIPKFISKFWRDKNFIKSVTVSIPRSLAQTSKQGTLLAAFAFAGSLATGGVSIFSLAQILYMVPIGLIGGSYNIASYPLLSDLNASDQREKFNSNLLQTMRHIIFWTIPITVLFIVLRAQVVRTVFGTGNFDWEDTRLVAASIAILITTLTLMCIINLFGQTMYIIERFKTAVILTISISVLSIALFPFYISLFQNFPQTLDFIESLLRVRGLDRTIILAIPSAIASANVIMFLFYLYFIKKYFGSIIHKARKTILQVLISSLVMGFVTYQGLQLFVEVFNTNTVIGIFLQGLCAGLTGILVHIAVLSLFNNDEIRAVWATVKTKVWKKKPVVDPVEQEEL